MSLDHPTTLRVVGYARASTDLQDTSVDRQVAWLNQRIERDSHTLAAPIFTDDAIAADDLARREGFRRMLDFCDRAYRDAEPVQGLVLFELSRFARNQAWWNEEFWNQLRRARLRWVITRSQTYDLTSLIDHLVRAIREGQDAEHSRTLAVGVAVGKAHRAGAASTSQRRRSATGPFTGRPPRRAGRPRPVGRFTPRRAR
jgi:hypothetical protein